MGWKQAGVIWPAAGSPTLAEIVRADGTIDPIAPPAELASVLGSLNSGSSTVVWQTPGTSGRLYATFQPPGLALGAVWVEKAGSDTWTQPERQYLLLALRMMERSTHLSAKTGYQLDSYKLSQRLNDASIIAARMAHDFDNILTGMIGFADLTLPLVPANSQPAKYVAQIGDVGKRGVSFTQQLHQLSRAGQAKPLPGSIAVALSKEELRLRPAMPAGLTLHTHIPAGLGAVGLDNAPLGIVLGHLLENAVEACGPGGQIQVNARTLDLDDATAKLYLGAAKAGPYIELTIRDDGLGVKPEQRAKLFAEPFFTTKVRHRGLGLAIVFRTLLVHGGGIRLEHQQSPERGTVARIVIPPATVRPAVLSATWTSASPAHLGAYP